MTDEPISKPTLNHFAMVAFNQDYWKLAPAERSDLLHDWQAGLKKAAAKVDLFQATDSGLDAVLWSAVEVQDANTAASFFDCFGRAMNPYRAWIETRSTLWGFTHPSQYSKARSRQEVDPFDPQHKSYLVIYPFAKNADWYLTSRDARQGIMNEHIRIGKQYEEISQLLLYSFGLQNQEFVVVYEVDDLPRFSDLVNELRDTEGRRYTLRDTPLHTAIYHRAEETLALWK